MGRRKKKIEEVIWGEIRERKDPDGYVRKHFYPNSPSHMSTVFSRYSVGKKIGMMPVAEDLSFSDAQRAYHFVLMGYIGHETGNTREDEHHDAMVEVFGTRTFKNFKGEIREGRYSISDAGGLKLDDVQKLIERDVGVCAFLEIRIPTKKELGYTEDKQYLGGEKYGIEYPSGPVSTEFD